MLLLHPWFEFLLAAVFVAHGLYSISTDKWSPWRPSKRDGAYARKWGTFTFILGIGWFAAGIAWLALHR